MPYNKGVYVNLTDEQVNFHKNCLVKPAENKLGDKFPLFAVPNIPLKAKANGDGTAKAAVPDQDDNDSQQWGAVDGLSLANTYSQTDKDANAKNLIPVPWSVWDDETNKVFAKCQEISKTELKKKVDLKRSKWSTGPAVVPVGASFQSVPYKADNRVVRCLGTCAKDDKATAWAHKLILYADLTRNPRGKAVLEAFKTLKADPATAHLADPDSGKFVADITGYKLESDIERDLFYLECIPKSARAYLALKYLEENKAFQKHDGFGVELQNAVKASLNPTKESKQKTRKDAQGSDSDYFTNASKGKNKEETGYKLNYETVDRIHNIFTPTPVCRAEWVRDALLDDYNIIFEKRVKTHREPLIEQWNAVHNIYGKAGPVSEDGLIQQGHYMRVGTKKAFKENKFNASLEIFWLSNREPPLGSKSAWIPDAFGGVREVWFSTADSAAEEEDRAFKDGRLPYMLYSEQVNARPWEMWSPDAALQLEDHQEIPYPSAVPVAPRLTVLADGEYQPSKTFEETQYYPSIGNNAAAGGTVATAVPSTMYNPTIPGSYAAPVAAPVAAAAPAPAPAAESGDYSDYSDYSDYGYGGYSDYSDGYGYSDYSY